MTEVEAGLPQIAAGCALRQPCRMLPETDRARIAAGPFSGGVT